MVSDFATTAPGTAWNELGRSPRVFEWEAKDRPRVWSTVSVDGNYVSIRHCDRDDCSFLTPPGVTRVFTRNSVVTFFNALSFGKPLSVISQLRRLRFSSCFILCRAPEPYSPNKQMRWMAPAPGMQGAGLQ